MSDYAMANGEAERPTDQQIATAIGRLTAQQEQASKDIEAVRRNQHEVNNNLNVAQLKNVEAQTALLKENQHQSKTLDRIEALMTETVTSLHAVVVDVGALKNWKEEVDPEIKKLAGIADFKDSLKKAAWYVLAGLMLAALLVWFGLAKR